MGKDFIHNIFRYRSPVQLGKRRHGNFGIGTAGVKRIPRRKRRRHQAISLYYALSTCDLYLVSKITNRTYPWSEALSLALGLRFEL